MTNLDLIGFFFGGFCCCCCFLFFLKGLCHYVSSLYLYDTICVVFSIRWTAATYKLVAKGNRYFLTAGNLKILVWGRLAFTLVQTGQPVGEINFWKWMVQMCMCSIITKGTSGNQVTPEWLYWFQEIEAVLLLTGTVNQCQNEKSWTIRK